MKDLDAAMIRLAEAGLSRRQIALELGVARNTVPKNLRRINHYNISSFLKPDDPGFADPENPPLRALMNCKQIALLYQGRRYD